MRFLTTMGLVLALSVPMASHAENKPVNISRDVMSIPVETDNGVVEISRVQDNENRVESDWARTSRPCPNFCVQPMVPADGVTPIGEQEVIKMLQDPQAVVVDSRVAKWFEDGTIPGATHIPYNEAVDRLDELGCEIDFDGWICEQAKPVALFCNGPWCGQSPTAIRAMVKAGFPADKIYYYRGGMQVWRILGLTVIKPNGD